MQPERWRQVEELYHAALESAPDQRSAFLDNACGSDTGLRHTLEALLAQGAQAGSFLETPALAMPRNPTSGESLLGRQIGVYRFVSRLGAGGMGEVYRAQDTKLGRDVAIKTLLGEFARDPEKLSRFGREARILASLNHPNIAMIHGLEESNGLSYLVLELVEGENLKERLDRTGPIPLPEALNICRQAADALGAAHSQAIVHRDLKPANVKVTPEGRVKVLDFGLAKAVHGDDPTLDLSSTGASTGLNSVAGQILGTPPYMSPEQTRGREVDKRTDIWAFGCLLYELLTGKPAFRHEMLADTISAIQGSEPNWQALPTDTPAKIRELLKRCLEKDAARRFQDISGVRSEIEEVLAPAGRGGLSRKQLAVALLATLTVLVLGVVLYRRASVRAPSRADWIQITNLPDSVTQPALSPDGRMLTFLRGPNSFVGKSEVYLKLLPDGEPVQLTRDGTPKMGPAFSRDGSRISYTVLSDQSGWDTWTVPVPGGTPQLWLPNVEGLSWIGKHSLLYSEIKTGQHMAIVTSLEDRAEHRDVYVPDHQGGMAHRSNISPDGKWVLIVEMDEKGVWLPCRLTPFDGSSAGRLVGPRGLCTSAAWSADGKWMYVSVNTIDNFHLWRQRFPDGKPEQLTSGPNAEEGIAIAPDGRSLITAVGLSQRPVWFHDATGDHQVSLEGYSFFPSFYQSGRKVVYRISNGYQGMGTMSKLWIGDLDSGRNEPLLPAFQVISHDVSRDGRVVVCALDAGGKPRLWLAALDRRTPPRQIGSVEATRAIFGPPGVIFFLATEGASAFLFAIGEDGTGLHKLLPAPIHELDGVSPDGRWVAANDGSSSHQGNSTYELAYPIAGGPPVALCNAPASVKWAPDGRYMYILKSSGFTNGGAVGRTYVLPTRPETMLPDLPAAGFRSDAELSAVPGVRIIEAADIDPGLTPDVYVFSRESVQRNLYRIPLP